jgi:glycogen synthase
MRILHLTTEFPPVIYGGLGTAVGGLVKASASVGMTTGVLLFGGAAGTAYGRLVPAAVNHAPATHRIADVTIFEVSWFQEIEAIARAAAMWRPDILHLHSFWLWPLAEAIRSRLGKPLVYTVHSLDRAEYEIGNGPPECLSQWVGQEAAIRGADRVIALTQSERRLLQEFCPGIDERVRIVGNGIDDIPSVAGDAFPKVGGTLVLFNGRFVERKGIRELLEAIGIVLDQVPTVRFVLAGGHRGCSGPQMESWLLPEQLRSRRAQIHFTGWLTPEQLAKWYRKADILVVPSWYEPFGMVVLEGMLHGLPIAATAVGGPAEILEHDRTGILFPARNANALAEATLRLINDPRLRGRIGAAAAAKVRQKWLWPRVIEEMRCVYEEIAPRRCRII